MMECYLTRWNEVLITCYNMDNLENTMLSERSKSQKPSYYKILFIWSVHNRQVNRAKQASGCHSVEMGHWWVTVNGYIVSVWDNKNILELGSW